MNRNSFNFSSFFNIPHLLLFIKSIILVKQHLEVFHRNPCNNTQILCLLLLLPCFPQPFTWLTPFQRQWLSQCSLNVSTRLLPHFLFPLLWQYPPWYPCGQSLDFLRLPFQCESCIGETEKRPPSCKLASLQATSLPSRYFTLPPFTSIWHTVRVCLLVWFFTFSPKSQLHKPPPCSVPVTGQQAFIGGERFVWSHVSAWLGFWSRVYSCLFEKSPSFLCIGELNPAGGFPLVCRRILGARSVPNHSVFEISASFLCSLTLGWGFLVFPINHFEC